MHFDLNRRERQPYSRTAMRQYIQNKNGGFTHFRAYPAVYALFFKNFLYSAKIPALLARGTIGAERRRKSSPKPFTFWEGYGIMQTRAVL